MGGFIPTLQMKASMDIQQMKKATTILTQSAVSPFSQSAKLSELFSIQFLNT